MPLMEIGKRRNEFYIKTGHGEALLSYRIIGKKVMSIYHTFTPEEERGRGIAEKLAIRAFEFANEKGLKVRPDCPYILHFLGKHKELRGQAVK